MRYILPDRTVITGHNYAQLVRAMSNQKMTTPRSLLAYRKAVARRIKGTLAPSTKIDTTSNKSFINSLVELKIIESA